ncbi:gastrula zinc finger protein XlCGF66.1-like [Phyllobates terribilis]|uniref:gastrula zinc finger protein XlCGF66.1-like n=1 Tax=Phyllobates terribilis TaxID=111132 RepID=UPI003CCB5E99
MVFFNNDPPTMDKHRNHMAADILDLTLEIIYLITGEDYTVVKKPPGKRGTPMSEGRSKTQSDITETTLPSLIHEQKIVELTNKITELLTGEVPLRCEDVTVYFTMEEWEYLEGHKDRYKDIMMKDHQPITSLETERPLLIKEEITDGSSMGNPLETCPYPIYPHGFPENMQIVQLDHQESYGEMTSGLENLISVKDEEWMRGSQEQLLISPFYELEYYQFLLGKKRSELDSIFECSECGKHFKNKSHLTVHEKTHRNEKPFPCSECGKCFSKKSSLVEHRKKHTGEKPFTCLECGKSFNRKAYLIGHQRTHAGVKPFSCSECSRSYNHKSSLMKHLTNHTGVKPYSCSECGKCFNRKSGLADHLRVHTGEKPYLCLLCGKCFSQNSGLIVHRRTHLKEKPI